MAARRISATGILTMAILGALVVILTGGRRLMAADEPLHGFDAANLDHSCKP